MRVPTLNSIGPLKNAWLQKNHLEIIKWRSSAKLLFASWQTRKRKGGQLTTKVYKYEGAFILFVTVKVRNESGDWCAEDENGEPIYDDFGNQKCGEGMIMPDGTKLNQGKGSIGMLINDPSLLNNATTTLQKVNKATESLEDQGPMSVIGMAVGNLF